MFDEIISFISTVFTIAIIIFAVFIVIAIIKGVESYQKNTEKIQREQDERQELINQVILDSQKFPTELLISQRNEMLQAYNTLYDCKQRGSMQTKELLPFFRVGDDLGCSVDLKTSHTILGILNDEIQRRQG